MQEAEPVLLNLLQIGLQRGRGAVGLHERTFPLTKATNIVSEGFSLKYEELYQSTSFRHWNIEKVSPLEKYSIHFMKFDLFGQLMWFGSVNQTLIQGNQDSTFLEDFKREVGSAIRAYEAVERSFLGSYIEKEDRFALDPQGSEQ